MATGGAYKTLGENDIVSTRTLLHEAIPITGSIVSGSAYSDNNVKNHSHGMFQSIYDYPVLSSSANHIFDITVGVASNSTITPTSQQSKKRNIYNQMSQVLVGYDITGSILEFDLDGDILAGGDQVKHRDVFIIPFSRLLVKDEIKKGTFTMTLGVGTNHTLPFATTINITDASGSDGYLVNSPAGEYGILFGSGGGITGTRPCGLLYYQAGICVLTASVFGELLTSPAVQMNAGTDQMPATLRSQTIQQNANNFRHRLLDLTFNNTTELNSTIYFCRAHHNEFNYSTNPTYLNNSKIRVKTNSTDNPVSYITTIGLYNDNNELMAVAKLSEPLKKTPDVEFTLRVRLDY
tara:strand:- start:21 stop:1070 length:1050 start_codon:yes stop_codon:yes gene_type:complete